MADEPAIDARDTSVGYGNTLLIDDLSFSLDRGRSLAITGRSGTGKSTLLGCILGMIPVKGGSLKVLGTDVFSLKRSRRAAFRAANIGVVFQSGELLDELSATENVALPRLFEASSRAQALSDAATILARLDVPQDTLARDLSGGEYQRASLARALVGEPALVLADEPTGSLDAELRDRAADLLFRQAEESGAALVVVTHDPSIAQRADTVIRLDHGA